jgi:O-antigen/teichoic acid export membrane protein
LIRRGYAASIALFNNGGIWLVVSMGLMNASSLIFNVVMSRVLGPSQYGGLAAVISLTLAATIAVNALQVTVVRAVVVLEGTGEDADPGRPVAVAIAIGLAVTVALAISAPAVSSFLKLDSRFVPVLLGLYLIPVLVGVVLRGVLIARNAFGRVSASIVLVAVLRIVLGVVLGRRSGVLGAVGALVIAETAGLIPLLRSSGLGAGGTRLLVGLRESLAATSAFAGFWIVMVIDTPVARHLFTTGQSGQYAAAATAGRAAFFVPQALAVIALPRFSKHDDASADDRDHVLATLALVVLGGAAVACVLAFGAPLVIRLAFGSRYVGAAGPLRVLAFSSAALGVANLMIHFLLARRSHAAQLSWLVPPVLIVVALVGIHSTIGLAVAEASAALAMSAILIACSARGFSRRPELVDEQAVLVASDGHLAGRLSIE